MNGSGYKFRILSNVDTNRFMRTFLRICKKHPMILEGICVKSKEGYMIYMKYMMNMEPNDLARHVFRDDGLWREIFVSRERVGDILRVFERIPGHGCYFSRIRREIFVK